MITERRSFSVYTLSKVKFNKNKNLLTFFSAIISKTDGATSDLAIRIAKSFSKANFSPNLLHKPRR